MDVTLTNFGETHFGTAPLGDQRATDRLVRVANRLAQHPDGSLPHKCHDQAELEALYHLMNRPKTTHAAVLEPHFTRTRQAITAHAGIVLLVHDDTDLDFSSRTTLRGELGPIGGQRQRGFICHNSLAITAAGQPLGLAGQLLHVNRSRRKKPSRKTLRECPRRQSRLWLRGRAAIGDVGPQAIDIVDRGGDTHEFFWFEEQHGYRYIARSKGCRRVVVGHGPEPHTAALTTLRDHLRSLPAQGSRPLVVNAAPAKPGCPARPGRTTTLAVAWAAVTLLAPTPSRARGQHGLEPLRVWSVRVWELDPPPNTPPLEWFLLTNVVVESPVAAWERVTWYEHRWPVAEEFHKGQKTGCDVTGPQFQTTAALTPMIGVLSVVAWLLMYLRWLGRHPEVADAPATRYVPLAWLELLHRWQASKKRPLADGPPEDWTLRTFLYVLASLGGYVKNPAKAPPGWQTLWKGWRKLWTVVEFTLGLPP